MQPFTAVFLAAGRSSRFGGRIKCLQEVGRHGETLIELSVRQLLDACPELSDLVMVVSESTHGPIHATVGDRFYGLPVSWCFQRTPAWRSKPLGTVDALLAARGHVRGPFVVLNGDSLYGVAALRLVCGHMVTERTPCMPGYKLRDVLPNEGRVNRALVQVDDSGHVSRIVEHYDIHMADVHAGQYTGDELTSMNIFGFVAPHAFELAARKHAAFLHQLERLRRGDGNQMNPPLPRQVACEVATTKEYILSTMLNELLAESAVRVRVLTSSAIRTPLELTNPGDFAFVKSHLDRVGL
ncbi:hypothetical protein CDCA_CDCA08G2358 [Cyanidium caldarium]|uniref:MobA-like NTP transferase domain-containing protein n=1 Tax=Cyanidium caldarium TaxID=2771 RepID=A0AAV9IW75_CYACA|nr:hypothetical protein CDCA_CDCA08G2358 [Cyanidium caldarium]